MVMSSIHPLNEKLFWYLGATDEQLSMFMLAVNIVNFTSLVPRSTRKVGLIVNTLFCTMGLVGQIRTGQGVVPHMVLISTSAAAAWMKK
jgi:hypothetical protein